MSYRCDFCGDVTAPRTKLSLIVVDRRDRQYHNRVRTEEGVYSFDTIGTEIVRELKACPKCVAVRRQAEQDRLIDALTRVENKMVVESASQFEAQLHATLGERMRAS